jgi:hypothetical protein
MKSEPTQEEIILSNGKCVLKSDYVNLKTKDLIEFGYNTLTEAETLSQVNKILEGDNELSVIGLICIDDIDVIKSQNIQP